MKKCIHLGCLGRLMAAIKMFHSPNHIVVSPQANLHTRYAVESRHEHVHEHVLQLSVTNIHSNTSPPSYPLVYIPCTKSSYPVNFCSFRMLILLQLTGIMSYISLRILLHSRQYPISKFSTFWLNEIYTTSQCGAYSMRKARRLSSTHILERSKKIVKPSARAKPNFHTQQMKAPPSLSYPHQAVQTNENIAPTAGAKDRV
jgi:hypothetical protein